MRRPFSIVTTAGRLLAASFLSLVVFVSAVPAQDALRTEPALSGAPTFMETAGDWLLGHQLPNGSFPWTVGGAASANVQAQPGLALIEAWRVTDRQDFLDAAVAAGDWLLNGGFEAFPGGHGPRIRSADPLFFYQLSQVSGDPTYNAYIQTHFWDRLVAGTYGPNGDWDIDDYVQSELDRRAAGAVPVLAAWDLVQVAIPAQITVRGTATVDALLAGAVSALELAPGEYDIVGLSWTVAGGALFGREMNPQAGHWAAMNTTAELADTLAGLPAAHGGFVYRTSSLGNPNSASSQSTAFALFGLASLDIAGYYPTIQNGLTFIEGKQAPGGQIVDINNPNVAGNVLGHADAMRIYGMVVTQFRSGIALSKTALPSVPEPSAGDTIDYQIVVQNTGNVPLVNVAVSDDLIGLTCVPVVPVASLSGGDSIQCTGTYTISQADFDSGDPIVNEASTSATNPNGKAYTAQDGTSTPLADAAPSISLVKSISGGDPYSATGDQIDYQFVILNDGNVSLADIDLTDDRIGAVTCPDNALAPGQSMVCSATYTIIGQDIADGSVTNVATVTADPARGTPSPVSDSDQATATYSIAAMTVQKTATPSATPPEAGDSIGYQIVVENTGTQPLSNVTVSDPLIALTCVPALPVATLASGDTIQCTGSHVISQASFDLGAPIINVATASATDPDSNLLQAQDGTSTSLADAVPAIDLTKVILSGNPYSAVGDEIDYLFTVANAGNVSLTGIVLSDDLIGSVNCPHAGLAPGQNMVCSATYTVDAQDISNGSVTNLATVTGLPVRGAPSPVSANDQATATYSISALTVDKIASPSVSPPAVGDSIGYQIVVENTGTEPLSNVTVSDPLITLTCVPALPVASLPAGQMIQCTGSHVISQAEFDQGSPIINVATASATGDGGVPVQAQDSTSTALAAAAPAIHLTKTITGGDPFSNAGDVIHYSFLIRNQGNVTLSGLTLLDDRIGTISCPVTQLAPAAQTTCVASDIVTAQDITSGQVVNVAVASALTPVGSPAVVDANASATARRSDVPPATEPLPIPVLNHLGTILLAMLLLMLGWRVRREY